VVNLSNFFKMLLEIMLIYVVMNKITTIITLSIIMLV
jgi:hypothetical protein